jgi:hypothetical protein
VFTATTWSPGLALSRAFGDTREQRPPARCCTLSRPARKRVLLVRPCSQLTYAPIASPPPLCPPAVAGSVGVTCKPEVTVLPLPPAPAAASRASLAAAGGGISNGSASTYCLSSSDTEAAADDKAAATVAASSSSRGRHVLIVASDGLWEWISNAAAVGIAASAASGEPHACCVPGRPTSSACRLMLPSNYAAPIPPPTLCLSPTLVHLLCCSRGCSAHAAGGGPKAVGGALPGAQLRRLHCGGRFPPPLSWRQHVTIAETSGGLACSRCPGS